MKIDAAGNEKSRLQALESYGILDTPREELFDNIAELAAEICGTPIGVVNFISDTRQFFKAETGLGVRSTPLETSLCAKAILETDFLIVPDTTRDPRFDCNPLLVGEPFIRFYAGALLKSHEGYPVGTLCVLGHEALDLTPTQQFSLRVLADQIMAQLEYRRQISDLTYDLRVERRLSSKRKAHVESVGAMTENLQEERQLAAAAHDAGGIGIFEANVETGTMTVSEEFCRLFGVAGKGAFAADYFESLILDEDRAFASNAQNGASGIASMEAEYRIRRADDQRVRWIARRAQFLENDCGELSKMVGVVLDITESKRKEERVEALLMLGDRLRSANTIVEVVQAASDTLASGLSADRAGYASLNPKNSTFTIEADTCSGLLGSWKGQHGIDLIARNICRLTSGQRQSGHHLNADWLGADRIYLSSIGVRSFLHIPLAENDVLTGFLFAHNATQRFWDKAEFDFADGVADRTYAAIAKLRAEAEQRLLNHELSHRLKNTLAIVQAIVSQTLRRVSDTAAVSALTGRIQALGSAHEVLLQQSWSNASLRQVIVRVMTLHASPERVTIDGPDVPLGPKAGLSMSLLLHELGTNAIKYGALSNETGRVSLTWTIENNENEPEIELVWRETGGPLVTAPAAEGFGSRLIGLGLNGAGNVVRRYDPEGVYASFRAPLNVISEID